MAVEFGKLLKSGAPGGLGLLALMLLPELFEPWRAGQKRARTMKDMADDPELLRKEFDKRYGESALANAQEEEGLRRLAAIGAANPRLVQTMRAKALRMDQPRLTGSEIRIGGPTDWEAADKMIAQELMNQGG